NQLSIVTLYWSFIALMAFLHSTFYDRLRRSFWVVAAALFAATVVPFLPVSSLTPILFSLPLVVAIVEGSRVIVASLWKKRDGARIIGAGFLVSFGLFTWIALVGLKILPQPTGSANFPLMALLAPALSSSIYLARNFARTSLGFEELSLHL